MSRRRARSSGRRRESTAPADAEAVAAIPRIRHVNRRGRGAISRELSAAYLADPIDAHDPPRDR